MTSPLSPTPAGGPHTPGTPTAEHRETIDTLNDLIETSRDGEYGFRSAAEHAKSADLQHLFTQRADECADAARQLQALIATLGGAARDGGTVAGAVHRGWVAVKSALAGATDLALLEEAERGEDVALEAYRQAMSAPLSFEARALVERQLEGVKRNHAQLRMLRDQARAAHEA